MVDLLLNPNGRLARHRFWQGMIILTMTSVVVGAAAWLLNPIFGLINYALIFPYICVYGKRLHDAGHSGWWVIAIWFAGFMMQVILLVMFLFTLMPILMTPEQIEIWNKILEYSEEGETAQVLQGFELLMVETEGLFQRTSLVLLVVANAIMALIIGGLKTVPHENKHGPVPGTSSADTFK